MSFERNAPYAATPDNRPRVVEDAPVALMREADTQMSFGERAAVEGLLGQLRPGLAVEIGWRRAAAYAGSALTRPRSTPSTSRTSLLGEVPANATLHTGPSAQLLPGLLESSASDGRTVDFALVDGDTSLEGVAGDLEALLGSPAARRTAILVHDTSMPRCAPGSRSVNSTPTRTSSTSSSTSSRAASTASAPRRTPPGAGWPSW